jgi:acyl-coenzyme A thioesterase PaaI-like protein
MRIPEMLRRHLSAKRRLEWYPPFHAMRVSVLALDQGWRRVRLLLPLAPNRNPGGGMFGGAMACLADPIAALACNRVFPGHKVWTRELTLDFARESRTDMELRFVFERATEDNIRDQLRERGRSTPTFEYAFFDTDGQACATVRCRVAIRSADYQPTVVKNSTGRNG